MDPESISDAVVASCEVIEGVCRTCGKTLSQAPYNCASEVRALQEN